MTDKALAAELARLRNDELIARYDAEAGPRTPPNGDHISLEEILAAHHKASTYNHSEYALDILFDSHRGVDVYHALNREAELGNIVPLLKAEKMNYIVRFRPAN